MEQQPSHIGYKVCRINKYDNEIVIVKLMILGNNNEDRSDVFDPETAKMRSSEVKVLEIYKKENCKVKRYPTAVSIYDPDFTYTLNETIKIKNYDTRKYVVCSPGIHYFLTEEAALCYGQIDPLNGKSIRYHDNGKVSSECYIINGQVHGKYASWHLNGTKNVECIYVNGKKNGKCVSWYDNGDIYYVKMYKDGKLNGRCRTWYKYGNKKNDGNYLCGMRDGEYKEYHRNGQLRKISMFYKGAIRGKCYKYNSLGELVYEYEYANDLNYSVKHYKNDVLISDISYVNGVQHGESKFWYDNGDLMYVCYFDNGNICDEFRC